MLTTTGAERRDWVATRRGFLGYVIGGTTLVAAADLRRGAPASRRPDPQIAEPYDLNDFLTDAARPTANLITIEVNEDGTVSFALPAGRGRPGHHHLVGDARSPRSWTSPLDRVGSRWPTPGPELLFNQLTGGSNTTISTYTPIRVAAAIARRALLDAAAVAARRRRRRRCSSTDGVITGRAGAALTSASSPSRPPAQTETVDGGAQGRARTSPVIGKPHSRDRRAATRSPGKKTSRWTSQVPDALPTMVCRAAHHQRHAGAVANLAEVRGMPGVTDVVDDRHRRGGARPRPSASASTPSAR